MRLMLAALIMLFVTGQSLAQSAFQSVRYEFEVSRGFKSASDVAVTASGDIAVLDAKAMKVLVFARDGALRTQFGDKSTLPRPVAIAAGPDGTLVLADDRRKEVLLFSAEGELLARFGSSGSASGQFKKLADVAIDHFGFIYVSDAGNRVVSKFTAQGVLLAERQFSEVVPGVLSVDRMGRVTLLSASGADVVRFRLDGRGGVSKLRFQEQPSGVGGIYVDRRGHVYLTRSSKHRVVKYDADGSLIASFGSRGKGPGAFSGPTRIAGNDQDEVFVVDGKNKRIQVFSLDGATDELLPAATQSPPTVVMRDIEVLNDAVSDLVLLGSEEQLRLFSKSSRILSKGVSTEVLGAPGRSAGQFKTPGGVARLPNGRLVVADTGNNRLQIVGAGQPPTVVGEKGKEPGFFSAPSDVAVNSQGLIYIADTGNARIQIFTDQGIFMHSFGSTGKSKKGTEPALGQFLKPTAVVIDSGDRVHILDSGLQRVVTFDARGQPLQSLTGFSLPVDVAVDETGNLFIADNGCSCIEVFDGQGGHLMRFGGAGGGAGQLGGMSAVASKDGLVMVAQGVGKSDLLSLTLSSVSGKGGPAKGVGAIKTFELNLGGEAFADRISVTHSYFVPENLDATQQARYRELAMEEAGRKLAAEVGLTVAEITPDLRVDEERPMGAGEIRLTLSAPAYLAGSATPGELETPIPEEPAEDEVKLAF